MIYFTKSEGVNFFNAGGNFFNFFQCRGVALIMKNTVKFQITNSEKLVILLIIPTYAKVSN
jgi:hypothetical protein